MDNYARVFVEGLLLQASLILALGAQNIFVLNAGLRRRRHLLVATVATLCDVLLVFTGVLGVATVFTRVPTLKVGLGLLGVGFLFFYGLLKIREAKNGMAATGQVDLPRTRRQTILATLGFSLLNPHVYLDTIVLIGGYSAQFDALATRFAFGLGAATGSGLWFFGLATLAARGGRVLDNPRAMRAVALASGLILVTLAWRLGADVLTWMNPSRS